MAAVQETKPVTDRRFIESRNQLKNPLIQQALDLQGLAWHGLVQAGLALDSFDEVLKSLPSLEGQPARKLESDIKSQERQLLAAIITAGKLYNEKNYAESVLALGPEFNRQSDNTIFTIREKWNTWRSHSEKYEELNHIGENSFTSASPPLLPKSAILQQLSALTRTSARELVSIADILSGPFGKIPSQTLSKVTEEQRYALVHGRRLIPSPPIPVQTKTIGIRIGNSPTFDEPIKPLRNDLKRAPKYFGKGASLATLALTAAAYYYGNEIKSTSFVTEFLSNIGQGDLVPLSLPREVTSPSEIEFGIRMLDKVGVKLDSTASLNSHINPDKAYEQPPGKAAQVGPPILNKKLRKGFSQPIDGQAEPLHCTIENGCETLQDINARNANKLKPAGGSKGPAATSQRRLSGAAAKGPAGGARSSGLSHKAKQGPITLEPLPFDPLEPHKNGFRFKLSDTHEVVDVNFLYAPGAVDVEVTEVSANGQTQTKLEPLIIRGSDASWAPDLAVEAVDFLIQRYGQRGLTREALEPIRTVNPFSGPAVTYTEFDLPDGALMSVTQGVAPGRAFTVNVVKPGATVLFVDNVYPFAGIPAAVHKKVPSINHSAVQDSLRASPREMRIVIPFSYVEGGHLNELQIEVRRSDRSYDLTMYPVIYDYSTGTPIRTISDTPTYSLSHSNSLRHILNSVRDQFRETFKNAQVLDRLCLVIGAPIEKYTLGPYRSIGFALSDLGVSVSNVRATQKDSETGKPLAGDFEISGPEAGKVHIGYTIGKWPNDPSYPEINYTITRANGEIQRVGDLLMHGGSPDSISQGESAILDAIQGLPGLSNLLQKIPNDRLEAWVSKILELGGVIPAEKNR